MQLAQFSGGKSNRLAPQFIQPTEGVIFKNIETTRGILEPIKSPLDLSISINKYFYKFKDTFISSNSKRYYLEYQEKLYYTEENTYPKKFDGTTENRLGIVGPTNIPVTVTDGVGPHIGTYQYCYTYYNEVDGTESKPSTYSDEIEATNEALRTQIILSDDPQVTHIRLYRIGGDITTMTLVIQLDNVSVFYTDSIADLDIDGSVLDTYNSYEAPDNLKYLVEAYASFFGAVGDKLWFSAAGFPNAWSPLQTIDFDADITGIGVLPEGILVFTKYKTYIITGTDSSTFVKYLLSSDQGCIAHSSINFIQNILVWASQDGICSSNGTAIQVISQDKLGNLDLVIESSLVFEDVYYLSTPTTLLCLDMRYNPIFKEFEVQGDYIASFDDTLYIHNNGALFELLKGTTDLTFTYKTGLLTDGGLTFNKNYSTIKARVIGELIVKVYIDEILVDTTIINEEEINTVDISLGRVSQAGFSLEFEVSGTGKLFEISYKVA